MYENVTSLLLPIKFAGKEKQKTKHYILLFLLVLSFVLYIIANMLFLFDRHNQRTRK